MNREITGSATVQATYAGVRGTFPGYQIIPYRVRKGSRREDYILAGMILAFGG